MIQNTVRDGLRQAARVLEPVDPAAALDLRRLAGEVDKPCTVAVVGRVKQGKSSVVNALLDADVAMEGTTETTATINHMVYGVPDTPDRPVLCVWRDGSIDACGRDFLDSLQGHDLATLQRANGISRLEYRLPNPFLRQATLVDTPGTGAAVDEHQNRTAAYLALENELRQRHDAETRAIEGRADAIIYVTGHVPKSNDLRFLEAFGRGTDEPSRALKAVAVITKIDSRPDVLSNPDEFAAEYAEALKGHMSAVIPVSASLCRAARRLQADEWAGMARLIDGVRRIPPATLERLLTSEEWLTDDDVSSGLDFAPLSRSEVLDLRSMVEHWSVFVIIAGIAVNDRGLDPAGVGARLTALSGFERLRMVLDRQFFARGHILRCFRIMDDAMAMLRTLRYDRITALHDAAAAAQLRHRRFSALLAGAFGDAAVRAELAAFLEDALADAAAAPGRMEHALDEAQRLLERVYGTLVKNNHDFNALQTMMASVDLFSREEWDELEPLFGRYGLERSARLPGKGKDRAYCAARQSHWSQRAHRERNPERRLVAQAAVERYGVLIREEGGGR